MDITGLDMRQVTSTIRSVVAAESRRHFKAERDGDGFYSGLVFLAIAFAIMPALYLIGLSEGQIMEVDPSDFILDQMKEDGYAVNFAVDLDMAHMHQDDADAFALDPGLLGRD